MRPASALPSFVERVELEEGPEGVRLRAVLRAEDAIYGGHFPEQPILPAIAQLELARCVASLATGAPQILTRIPSLKLRQTLTPGMAIELELGPEDPGGARRFAIRAGGPPVSQGSLAFEALDSEKPEPAPSTFSLENGSTDTFADPAELLPHRPPAGFLDRVVDAGDGRIVCLGRVPREHALVRDGAAPSFLALEAGAQAAGVLEALESRAAGGPPRVGYIVGLRDVALATAPLAAGTPFRIEARRAGGAGALAIYELVAGEGLRPLARGTVSAFIPEPP